MRYRKLNYPNSLRNRNWVRIDGGEQLPAIFPTLLSRCPPEYVLFSLFSLSSGFLFFKVFSFQLFVFS